MSIANRRSLWYAAGIGAFILAGCISSSRRHSLGDLPIVVSASKTEVRGPDSVTFTAAIGPDLSRALNRGDTLRDSNAMRPHAVGWFWVPDLDAIDPWTRACGSRELSCRIMLHGSGTMVFSVRLQGEVCAGWVHVEMLSLPDVDQDEPRKRAYADSVSRAIKTKSATWERCSS